jgi:hypothetical protein
MTTLALSGVLTDASGASYKFSGTLDQVAQVPPVVAPPVVIPPVETPSDASIPLSPNDARFAKNATAKSTKVANGGMISNKRITDTGQIASIIFGNGGTAKDCCIVSREGIRIEGGGSFLIDGCYIEVNGTGNDHADGVQAYAPGSKGVIKGRNSLIKCGQDQATAGFFVADNWTGEVDLENFLFQGGPFGLRLHADKGGDINVSLKDVYFIGPFMYKPFYFLNYGGHKVVIKKWENVRQATIVNGQLVLGAVIPRPF